MALVSELLNKGKCSVQGTAGALGAETSKGCATFLTAAKIVLLIAPGAEIKKDAELYSEIDRLMLANKMRVLNGIQNFEQNGSDDAVETLADDTQRVTNEGKYAFLATYTNGLYFNKALHSVKGFKRWNTMIIDEEKIIGLETETGLTGFTTGMLQPAKLVPPTPSAGQTEGLKFQMLNRWELDSDFGYIVDANLKKLKGITEVELEFVNEPAALDTTITVDAVLAMDAGTPYEGAAFGDFRVTYNGTANNPTAGDDSALAGRYVLTVPSITAGDEVVVTMPIHKGPDGDYYQAVAGAKANVPV